MAQRGIGVTDLAGGAGVAEYRTRERTVDALAVVEQYMIYEPERVVSWHGCGTTFRMPCASGSTINFSTLFNKVGSGVLVGLHRLIAQADSTASRSSFQHIGTYLVAAAPTGGTLLTPTGFDSAQTQAALVELRGATGSDGAAQASVTATAGALVWANMTHRMHSGTNGWQQVFEDEHQLPAWEFKDADSIVLGEGEGLVVRTLDMPSNTHVLINWMWEEFTLP